MLFDDEIMARMNYEVDEENREPRDVAREFLEEQGIIGPQEAAGRTRRVIIGSDK